MNGTVGSVKGKNADGIAAHGTSGAPRSSPALVRTLLLGSDRLALISPLQIEAELRCGQLAV